PPDGGTANCWEIDFFWLLYILLAPEVLAKMSHPYIGSYRAILFKINIIKSPIMRQVRTNQYYISCFKLFDTVADELCAFTFIKMDQFDFGMIMPAVIDVRNKIPPYTKRM